MTFYPKQGLQGTEDFNSSLGFSFSNPSLQGIVGSYLTLISTLTGSDSILNFWADVNNWTIENNLSTKIEASGTFTLYTGNSSSIQNTITGSQGILNNITAWTIKTDYPSYVSGHYTGVGPFGFALQSGSPDSSFYNSYVSGGSQNITIEFDVASLEAYSGLTTIEGYSSGLSEYTPPLSGTVGHGVLFSDGSLWDYFEITPYGIRSYNNPHLALPIDLSGPKRIRIGIRNTDIFLSTEDGRSVAGYSYLARGVTNPDSRPILFFGSLGKDFTFCKTHNILQGTDTCYGHTIWDNIKILTGQLAIFENQVEDIRYSTGFVSCYTPEFNPGVSISNFVSASIESIPYNGGITQASIQYSGISGWTTHSTKTITGAYTEFDLSSIPVYIYPRVDNSNNYLYNPLRFKIDQRSYSGIALPPVISKATILASDSFTKIDFLPDWKPYTSSIYSEVAIVTGLHIQTDPAPSTWSTFLFNAPISTGRASSFTDEAQEKAITVVGTGEVILEGPYRSCFKNYIETTGHALASSEAYQIFGSTAQTNYFSNPLFESYRTITTGEPGYVSGLVNGELADSVYILGSYVGEYKVSYTKDSIYRLDRQARANQISSYFGSSLNQEFAQGLLSYPSTGYHNGTVGLEAKVASGIANGNLLVSFDLEIAKGSGISLSISGSSISNYYLPGDSYRTYSQVTVPASNNYSKMYIKLYIPSGASQEEIKFNIDNLNISNYSNSYLISTGHPVTAHISGTAYTGQDYTTAYRKGATVAYGSIYLDSYPSTNSGVFLSAKSNNKGLEIFIDNSGYVSALVDVVSNAWATGTSSAPYNIYYPKQKITSESRVPLGRWTNIGFMHDVHTYDHFSYSNISTLNSLYNFTASNKLVLTFDGSLVASKDIASGWKIKSTNSLDSAPFSSYVDLTGSYSIYMASGLLCKLDGVHLLNPPVSEVETELSVKAARSTVPYFVPDILYKNGPDNLLLTGSTGSLGYDYNVGMCYNFSSPYFSNWDRGPIRNHLIGYGAISNDLNSPYGNLRSTRLYSGSYYVSPYSSAYERLFNTTGALDITGYTSFGINSGSFNLFGWVYPRTTGTFFTFLQDKNSGNAARLQLELNTGQYLVANKFDNANSIVYSNTGQRLDLNDWSSFHITYNSSNYKAYGNTGVVTCLIGDGQQNYSSIVPKTGVNFGLLYLGKSGDSSESCFKFGGTSDLNLFNVVIPFQYSTSGINLAAYTGSKGGRYQAVLEDTNVFTGTVICNSYDKLLVKLDPVEEPKNRYFSVGILNTYDTVPRLNGIVAHDNRPFIEAGSYVLGYDFSSIYNIFGTTDSPIRLGNQVPDTAINIARFSSSPYTVSSSISTIDLSDKNINNLISYKDGEYLINRTSVIPSSLTSYNNINSGIYSGMADVAFSGQVASSDVEVSTLSICDPSLDRGYTAYYYYLVGRGEKVVKILNTYPHYIGQISGSSTGSSLDNYFSNLSKLKSSIKLKNKKGEIIDKNTYPYDIFYSPYTPSSLVSSYKNSEDIYLDNLGPVNNNILPDGFFTVILLTHFNRINGESVFVCYDGYDISNDTSYTSYKEVVNPQPIFRPRDSSESIGIGKFDLDLNNNTYYNLNLYGIEKAYSGQF